MSGESIPSDVITSRVCQFWMNGPMIRARFLPRAEVQLADAQEAMAIMAELGGGVLRPCLVDLRDIRAQTAEARAHFAGPAGITIAAAVGLYVASPLSRVMGNFFIGLNRSEVPTRLFTDYGEATAWLRRYLPAVAA